MKKILIGSLILIFLAAPALAADFNPGYIISDLEVLDYRVMTLAEIKTFIDNQPGGLKNYLVTEKDGLPVEAGTVMTPAEVIYDRAVTNKVSPKLLLVLIQKEQSLF